MKDSQSLSRRDFVKTAAVGAAALSIPLLSSCSSIGTTGGVITMLLQPGVQDDCTSSYLTAGGKSIEIDGVEIKLPVDWNYAHSRQSNFNGNNWSGDDSVRGIGIFNCDEEGDNDLYPTSYAVNVRWEYASHGYTMGKYTSHADYTGTSITTGITVGGTTAGVVNIGNSNSEEQKATAKAKVVVYNPDTGQACVCAPGFNAIDGYTGSFGSTNCNWGGNPLALLGGITTVVAEAIGAVQNTSVLELFFVDPETELGPCEWDGSYANFSSNKCTNTISIDNSSISACAVGVAFDKNRPNYAGHEMIYSGICGHGSSCNSALPTTNGAITLREAMCGDQQTADCGMFVASVLRATVDQNYPSSGTDTQRNYLQRNSDKYSEVASGVRVYSVDESILSPGDIFVTQSGETGHTFIYVGSTAVSAQFTYLSSDTSFKQVSASLDEYGPKIKTLNADSRQYHVFRFIGEADPSPEAENL